MNSEENIFENLCIVLEHEVSNPAKVAAVITYEEDLSEDLMEKLCVEELSPEDILSILESDEMQDILTGITEHNSFTIDGLRSTYYVYTDNEVDSIREDRVDEEMDEVEEMFDRHDKGFIFQGVSAEIREILYDYYDEELCCGEYLGSYYDSSSYQYIKIFSD